LKRAESAFREERCLVEMAIANRKRMFPCPVCVDPREVRVTKKDKPYISVTRAGFRFLFESLLASKASTGQSMKPARTVCCGSQRWDGTIA
jgi:hypothetical protein